MTGTTTGFDKAAELLQSAQDAQNQGDVVGMLSALTESRFLDGLKQRLQRQWSDSLPLIELDDCVAQAVDAACTAGFEGRRVRNLGPWLWKTATNMANDRWSLDYALRDDFDGTIRQTVADAGDTDTEREERRELEEFRRKEAVRIARELLPRIGGGQILGVMKLVIDAVEGRLPDLPASLIAETLGISASAVRKLISRGLRRLSRLAEQEGVEFPMALPDTDTHFDEQEREHE